MACGDAAELFELVEEALDAVAFFIEGDVVGSLLFAIPFGGMTISVPFFSSSTMRYPAS